MPGNRGYGVGLKPLAKMIEETLGFPVDQRVNGVVPTTTEQTPMKTEHELISEMRCCDWSSDVCSSDLLRLRLLAGCRLSGRLPGCGLRCSKTMLLN